MPKGRQPNNDDILDAAAPSTLEQATGSGNETAVAIRDNVEEIEAREDTVSLSGFSSNPTLSAKDVQTPYLRLAQGLTQEVQDGLARPGQWLLSGEEGAESYTIIPLQMQAGRERRDGAEGGKLLCHSNNRVVGYGIPGGACDICPFSQWTDYTDPNTGEVKRRPPQCTETYRYIVYVEEADTLAVLTFKRTSYNVGKKLNAFIQSKRLGHFAVTLSSSRNKGEKGTYASPTIAPAKVNPDTLEYARSLIG